ncbi:MAG TPA: peptidoglycan-binding domain-containing protein, partial [Steroidobacteraceae bacterium]
SEEGPPADFDKRLEALDKDLSIGATGEDVRTVHTYLSQYGYFPNAKLARRYPAWRPIVATAPAAGVYDEHTAQAIRALQHAEGLVATGIVDATTREVLKTARCGVPDGMPEFDPSNKFWHSTTGQFGFIARASPATQV